MSQQYDIGASNLMMYHYYSTGYRILLYCFCLKELLVVRLTDTFATFEASTILENAPWEADMDGITGCS